MVHINSLENNKMKALNLLNKRFGKLKVIENLGSRNGLIFWKCKCDCGNECESPSNQLNAGNRTSCGCLHRKDYTNQTFGSLVALERIPGKRTKYKCKCVCGKEIFVDGAKLKNRKSCGCQRKGSTPRLKIRDVVSNFLFGSYKRNAKIKQISFRLTKKEFTQMIFEKCYYCGSPPATHFKKWRAKEKCFYNGIDRLDNRQGYIKTNVVTCCKQCNYKKGDQHIDDFLKWVSRVSDNRRGNNAAA